MEWGAQLKAAQDWTSCRKTVETLYIAWHEKSTWWNLNKWDYFGEITLNSWYISDTTEAKANFVSDIKFQKKIK